MDVRAQTVSGWLELSSAKFLPVSARIVHSANSGRIDQEI